MFAVFFMCFQSYISSIRTS